MTETSAGLTRINDLLARANGKRRERKLVLSDVAHALKRCVSRGHHPYLVTFDGGHVASAYNYAATTTVALVCRLDDGVWLGITTCPAHAASPGRAWKCLQPWRWPNQDNRLLEKLAVWKESPNVIHLDESTVGLLVAMAEGCE